MTGQASSRLQQQQQQQAMDLLSRNTVVCRTVDGGGVQGVAGKNTIMIAGRGVERVVVSYPPVQTDSRRRGTKCCSLWS